MMEVLQAFVGEAGAALESSHVGQSRKVIVQPPSSCGLHVQFAVTVAGGVGLHTHTHKNMLYVMQTSPVIQKWQLKDVGPSILGCRQTVSK